jgi:GntR family transcriptional regulator, transcriptional repressor for pyruvate dehydrogenase complex
LRRKGSNLQNNRLSDQIKEALVTDILAGIFKPGDKLLPEDQIAREFMVSKVTVREALRSLEGEGLIEKRRGPAGGSFVAKPGTQSMTLIFQNYYRFGTVSAEAMVEFRRIMEPGFAALAAVRRTEEDLGKLEAHMASFEQWLNQGAPQPDLLLFHSHVAHACHNPLISSVSDALLDVFRKIVAQFEVRPEDNDFHIKCEKEIYSVIRDRKPEKARKLMVAHFRSLAMIAGRVKKTAL